MLSKNKFRGWLCSIFTERDVQICAEIIASLYQFENGGSTIIWHRDPSAVFSWKFNLRIVYFYFSNPKIFYALISRHSLVAWPIHRPFWTFNSEILIFSFFCKIKTKLARNDTTLNTHDFNFCLFPKDPRKARFIW